MRSPFRSHQRAVRAQLVIHGAVMGADNVAPPRPTNGPEATEYELLLAELGNDMRTLSDIQSTERKIEAKRSMVLRYQDHVIASLVASLESGKAVQDEVLVTMMIWHFDIGEWPTALDIAEHVLRFGLTLPTRFQRSAPTLVAEEVAEAALAAVRQDQDFPLDILQRASSLTEGRDMPDQVRAKLHKAIALMFLRTAAAVEETGDGPAGAAQAARQQALIHFQRALALFKNIGVKKDIERLTAQLAKAPAGT